MNKAVVYCWCWSEEGYVTSRQGLKTTKRRRLGWVGLAMELGLIGLGLGGDDPSKLKERWGSKN